MRGDGHPLQSVKSRTNATATSTTKEDATVTTTATDAMTTPTATVMANTTTTDAATACRQRRGMEEQLGKGAS